MNIINIILILVVVAVSASDFLLSKFKRKGIDGSVVLFDKKKNKSESKSSKFYTKSYFLIPAISLISFGLSFLIPDINFTIFKYYVINPRDIVVFFSLLFVYTLFAINSYLAEIKNEKKKAREVLFFLLNIFIILILFGSHLIIENRSDFLINDLEDKIQESYKLERISRSYTNSNIYYTGGLELSPYLSFIEIKDFEKEKLNAESLGVGLDDFQRVEIYSSKFDFLFENVKQTSEGFLYFDDSQFQNYNKRLTDENSQLLGIPKSLEMTSIRGLSEFESLYVKYNKLNFSFLSDHRVFGKFKFKNIDKDYKYSTEKKSYYLSDRYGKSFFWDSGWVGPDTYYRTKDGKYVESSLASVTENYYDGASMCEIWVCERKRSLRSVTVDVEYIPSQFELKYSNLTKYPSLVPLKDMESYLKMILSNPENNLSGQEILDLFDKKIYLSHNINAFEVRDKLTESKYLLQYSIWDNINLGSISLAIFILAYPLRFVIWILLAIFSATYKTIWWSIKTYFQD